MKKFEIVFRYFLFLIGLFIASIGVAFSTKAGLGTSPVASIPYSISLISSIFTLGGWLNLLSIIQIAIQIILLRKNCKWLEILIQTILAFAFGYLTNFSCYLIKGINVDGYLMQIFYLLLSCLILGFGIWIQLKGGVAMLPGEAMNRAIAFVTGKKYENIKIVFDILYILISAAISFLFLKKLVGVREGSIIAAFLVGLIIKGINFVYKKVFNKFSC